MTTPLIEVIESLIKMVNDSHTDGFFWPLEFGSPHEYLKNKFNNQYAIYRMPSGNLVLKVGAYELYGYKNETIFIQDCRLGALKAKTIQGAMTLGVVRLISNGYDNEIHVFPKDCGGRLIYRPENGTELHEINDILAKIFPEAKIKIVRSGLAAIWAGNPGYESILRGRWILKTEAMWSLAFLVSLIIFTIIILCANLKYHSSYIGWIAIATVGSFIYFASKTFHLIHDLTSNRTNTDNSAR